MSLIAKIDHAEVVAVDRVEGSLFSLVTFKQEAGETYTFREQDPTRFRVGARGSLELTVHMEGPDPAAVTIHRWDLETT